MKFYILGLVATFTISSVKGQCQEPGNAKCFSASDPIGPVGSSCCSGARCQPWLEPGEIFTIPVDWYCQYIQPLGLNEACDNKRGKCARGLNCIAGSCSNQAIPATTPAVTTPAITTPAITTPAVCDAMAGDLCLYTQYNIKKTCCSPFVCTSVSAKSSVCKGESLSAGDSCFKTGAGSLGSCAEPLICLDGVCKEPSTECIDPVNGVCYIEDGKYSVGTCCSGSQCLAVAGSSDKFCQQQNIPLGGDCNQTEHRGVCDVGLKLKCVAGTCVDKLQAGETCFESGVGSVGSCAVPLICLNDVCSEPSTTCTDPVNGKCTPLTKCCAGSYCLPDADNTDTYCGQFIQNGGNCNQTEHRGRCLTGNFCIEGICVDGASTVPTIPAAACLAAGELFVNAATGVQMGECCPANDANNPTGGPTDFTDFTAEGIKCAAAA